jgi:hypothetical protein
MRAMTTAVVLSLLATSHVDAGSLLDRHPWLVTKAWYQLCGGNPRLPFDTQWSCCCFSPETGKHCVRHGRAGVLLACVDICNASLCR